MSAPVPDASREDNGGAWCKACERYFRDEHSHAPVPDATGDQAGAGITSATRHESAVTLGLSCGHAVLRRPGYQIPMNLETDCEVCAAERGRSRGEVSS